MRKMFGFFSETQAELIGVVEYTLPGGGTAQVSSVGDDPQFSCKNFSDMKCVGEVGEFVRQVSRGKLQLMDWTERRTDYKFKK